MSFADQERRQHRKVYRVVGAVGIVPESASKASLGLLASCASVQAREGSVFCRHRGYRRRSGPVYAGGAQGEDKRLGEHIWGGLEYGR